MPRWVGDCVMATPMLRSLRAHLGRDGRITAVMPPVMGDLLAGTGWIDDSIAYDRHGDDPSIGFKVAAAALRRDPADVALVLPNSLSAAALPFMGRIRRRVGYGTGLRRMFLTDVVRSHGPRRRAGDITPPRAFMELAAEIGVPSGPLSLELVATPADQERADAVIADLFPGRHGPLIVLNDNSSNGSARSWGVEKFADLATWLVEEVPGCRVLMHCGPKDRQQARAVVARAKSPSIRGLGDLVAQPLSLSKGIYARAVVAVSSDSGPRHIAAAFGVPTVALIGPTEPLSGRSDERHCVEIRLELPCSPCGEQICPLVHHDCMRLIDVERVGQAVLDLLRTRNPVEA